MSGRLTMIWSALERVRHERVGQAGALPCAVPHGPHPRRERAFHGRLISARSRRPAHHLRIDLRRGSWRRRRAWGRNHPTCLQLLFAAVDAIKDTSRRLAAGEARRTPSRSRRCCRGSRRRTAVRPRRQCRQPQACRAHPPQIRHAHRPRWHRGLPPLRRQTRLRRAGGRGDQGGVRPDFFGKARPHARPWRRVAGRSPPRRGA